MLLPIGFGLAGLFGQKPSEKTAKAIAIATLVIGAVIAFFILKAIYDASIVDDYKDKRDAEIATGVVTADRYAGERKTERDQDFANSQADLGNAIGNAVAADPEQARKPVGPASQSYYDELRRQRQQEKNR